MKRVRGSRRVNDERCTAEGKEWKTKKRRLRKCTKKERRRKTKKKLKKTKS